MKALDRFIAAVAPVALAVSCATAPAPRAEVRLAEVRLSDPLGICHDTLLKLSALLNILDNDSEVVTKSTSSGAYTCVQYVSEHLQYVRSYAEHLYMDANLTCFTGDRHEASVALGRIRKDLQNIVHTCNQRSGNPEGK